LVFIPQLFLLSFRSGAEESAFRFSLFAFRFLLSIPTGNLLLRLLPQIGLHSYRIFHTKPNPPLDTAFILKTENR
jgi:hypothetical protein